MVRKKSKHNWKPLYDEILYTDPAGKHPPPSDPPSEQELSEFEEKMAFKLPSSYRNFILLFGPGQIASEFFIFAPGCIRRINLLHHNQQFKKGFLYPEDTDVQLLRMVYFCDTINNDSFGWDPEIITDQKENECAIFLLLRLGDTATKVAGSFREFIEEFCLGEAYFKNYSKKRYISGPRRIFMSAPCRAKKKSEKN